MFYRDSNVRKISTNIFLGQYCHKIHMQLTTLEINSEIHSILKKNEKFFKKVKYKKCLIRNFHFIIFI